MDRKRYWQSNPRSIFFFCRFCFKKWPVAGTVNAILKAARARNCTRWSFRRNKQKVHWSLEEVRPFHFIIRRKGLSTEKQTWWKISTRPSKNCANLSFCWWDVYGGNLLAESFGFLVVLGLVLLVFGRKYFLEIIFWPFWWKVFVESFGGKLAIKLQIETSAMKFWLLPHRHFFSNLPLHKVE